jgi:hypothetical protein
VAADSPKSTDGACDQPLAASRRDVGVSPVHSRKARKKELGHATILENREIRTYGAGYSERVAGR